MEERQPKFQPMEWAVLLNDNGGRLCQVETTLWFGETERAVEYYVQPGDKKSRYQLYPEAEIGWPVSSMVKVPDKKTAETVVKLLKEEAERGQQLVRQAQQEARNALYRTTRLVREMVGDVESGE